MANLPRLALATIATLTTTAALMSPAPAQAAREPWSSMKQARQVTDPRITEASGLTRSTYARSTIMVHNDSGDTSRFFALSRTGATRAVFTLPSAPHNDWEDAASGPHHTLWFGDIGDNSVHRSTISVIRVKEPRDLTSRSLASRTFTLRYPDGAHNAEALMVRPRSGRVYIVTKDASGGHIYRAPKTLRAGAVNRLKKVASAPATVTGADFSPNGERFVLRTYTRAYLYRGVGKSAFRVIRLPSSGESIGYSRSGRAINIGSEGADQPIWRIDR
ncbi:exported hypothetical protein [metagenome]|uniref:Uncharacterized protein n=1 Tax=metagenome TaxID=256318 RepID=A0A2P2C508_9ZZZZ